MKLLITLFISSFLVQSAEAARIKDIATLKGARSNQLVGYGIVVGLPGTGDKASELTDSSLSQVLKSLGVDLKIPKVESKNTAAVVVSATLPPFAKIGAQLDLSLAAIGTSTQLDGGTLMMTSLRGSDGKIYAMGYGKILVLKRESKGGGGGSGQASPPNWLVPGGGVLERENEWDFSQSKELKYQLTVPDFTTAVRVARRINDELGGKYATAMDASTIDVIYPYTFDGSPVELIAQIETVEVETDRRAKVVINSKTGTVVLGDQVRISAVAIAHANLKVEVKEEPRAPAAASESSKETEKGAGKGVDKAAAKSDEEPKEGASKNKKIVLMDEGSTISEIVSGLNDMGASSDDLAALIQALKNAGALMAEVEIQ